MKTHLNSLAAARLEHTLYRHRRRNARATTEQATANRHVRTRQRSANTLQYRNTHCSDKPSEQLYIMLRSQGTIWKHPIRK
jgi:hypothetical protein